MYIYMFYILFVFYFAMNTFIGSSILDNIYIYIYRFQNRYIINKCINIEIYRFSYTHNNGCLSCRRPNGLMLGYVSREPFHHWVRHDDDERLSNVVHC